jgi:hypothetical protein
MYNDKLIKQFGKEMNIEGDSFYAVKQQYIKWLENKVESAMCEANSVTRWNAQGKEKINAVFS